MATGIAALVGLPTITTTTPPQMGAINSYNAAAGALPITLPALSSVSVGAYSLLEKSILDTTLNTVTFTANAGDTFDDLSTALVLGRPSEKFLLQVVSINATKFWKVTGYTGRRDGLTAITSEFSLTNSSAATTIVTYSVPPVTLGAGSAFRIRLDGTIQTQATSGTLTFTPFIQNTALAQTAVLSTRTNANATSPFFLEYMFTVRTAGLTGTAIAKPYGIINLATDGAFYLNSTSTATTTINTTSSATTPTLYVQATWQTASATNTLLVETATIERVI